MQQLSNRKTNPTCEAAPYGAYIVQVKDNTLPGVYHWVCHCYTMEDAEKIANLLMDADTDCKAFIQITYELKTTRNK